MELRELPRYALINRVEALEKQNAKMLDMLQSIACLIEEKEIISMSANPFAGLKALIAEIECGI